MRSLSAPEIVASMFLVCVSSTAVAQDFHKQKLAQWGDPFTPVQTRTRCIGEAWGHIPLVSENWRSCNEWATDTSSMQCEVTLRVPTVASLPAAAQSAAQTVAKTCSGVALATGAAVFTGTPSPELSARVAAALATLKPAFVSCVSSEGGVALAALTLTLEQGCGWSKWSNE
jgi:hypothetical protein